VPARFSELAVWVNGAPAGWTSEGRSIYVRVRRRPRTISVSARLAGRGTGSLAVTMRNGKLAIPVR
jgi:hypothetical protein